jgi:uncharacterized protein Yka (UPF0111/DUF47 family)
MQRREYGVRMDQKKIISRLELVKDIDPFNSKILNDCYKTIKDLLNKVDALEKQLDELTRK